MESTGATVWWIDGQYNVRSSMISSSRIYSGRTYQSEAMYVMSDDAKDYIIILNESAGEPHQIEALDKFKKRAEEMRA